MEWGGKVHWLLEQRPRPTHLRTEEGLPIIKKKKKEMMLSIELKALRMLDKCPTTELINLQPPGCDYF